MSDNTFSPGDKVDYHSTPGGPITSKDHTIKKVFPIPNEYGRDVAWISGKSGFVSCDALTFADERADLQECGNCAHGKACLLTARKSPCKFFELKKPSRRCVLLFKEEQ